MKKYFILMLIFMCFNSILKSQDEIKPTENEVLVNVLVADNNKNPLPQETVIFTGVNTKKSYTITTNNEGKSSILLPKGDTFEVSYKDLLKEKDYASVDIPTKKGLFTYNIDIIYEPSKIFTLENVYFEFGKSTLKPESYPAIEELVSLLKTESTMKIEISGHTDNIGNPETNIKLSKDRAEAVRQYIIKKGISANRVSSVGYGNTKPIATNETEEGRQLNRRTEVKILNK
jgi:outer membrane protein OmpA-like peptidoglycan-associated protein